MSYTNSAPTWEVISQQPSNGPLASGSYGPGHLIVARLASGSSFQVFIPNDDYASIDKVRAILAAKASSVDAVDNLTGGAGG